VAHVEARDHRERGRVGHLADVGTEDQARFR
jgi:hypothetical protein